MRKFALFCAVALLVSFLSTGCSTSGSGNGLTSWCRTGSLFPQSQSQMPQNVYLTGSYSSCDPCTPIACNPCEPVACNPCEPVCDPCVRTFTTRAPIPGPF